MSSQIQNENPVIYQKSEINREETNLVEDDNIERESIDALEVFELLRHINDPEHPLTLEELNVVTLEQIKVHDVAPIAKCFVTYTPTIPHCSMATLIGLCIVTQLKRFLPTRFKIFVSIAPGTHSQENAVNRQLADKERVCAALEKANLVTVVNTCLAKKQT